MSAWTVSAAAPVVGARHLAAKGRVAPTRVATSAGRVAPAPTRGATLRVSAEGERRNPNRSGSLSVHARARSSLPPTPSTPPAPNNRSPAAVTWHRKQTVTNESARVSLVPIFPDRVASSPALALFPSLPSPTADPSSPLPRRLLHLSASEKNLEVMRKFSEQYAKGSGTYFCMDKSVTAVVIQGLAEHKDTLGSPLCPCRHYDDKEAEVASGFWNCPCVPMRERKECHCMLFLTEDNDFVGDEQTITIEEVVELSEGM